MTRLFPVTVSALCLAASVGASAASGALTPKLSAAEKAAAARITAAEISAHTRFLSDDLLEGRFPGSRGDALAMAYLAAQLEAFGYQPGATGADGKPSWFQPVPLVKHTSTVPSTVTFQGAGQQLALPTGPGVEAQIKVRSLGDVDRVSVKDAELVFVGYGIVAPEHGWDDYRGVDVKGKIVVLLNFNPPWAGEGVRLWYGRWDYKYLEAARHGAIGALMIHTTESAGYPWQVVATSNSAAAFGLEGDPDPRLPFQGWIGHEAATQLFRLGQRSLYSDEQLAKAVGFKAVPLGVTGSLDMPVARERIDSTNVVGLLPGTDPKLKAEAVLYTAHHDHLGIRNPPVEGEHNIYNGAVDNASGCAAILTIAHAFAAAPPRRSVIVVSVAGEEQGLLGSHWYATHPTVPAGRLAVDINIDGINMNGRTGDVGFLGLGRSSIDGVVKALAAAQGRTVHGDPFPDRGLFYRSDDFELARVGVPGARVQGGPSYVGRPPGWGKEQVEHFERHDYHQPSDVYPQSPQAWDLSGAVEDAQLQLLIGRRVANDSALPQWKAGDEFDKLRRAAIEQATSQGGTP
jgi:Zn-dependent M28 family amino/carboxypeptidase